MCGLNFFKFSHHSYGVPFKQKIRRKTPQKCSFHRVGKETLISNYRCFINIKFCFQKIKRKPNFVSLFLINKAVKYKDKSSNCKNYQKFETKIF